MSTAPFRDLQQFIAALERTGQLKRVRVEVDPVLEASEIAQRVLIEGGPALLFERPKGSSTPLVMNLFGSASRVRLALGREPAEIGHTLLETAQRLNPPSLKALWQSRKTVARLRHMRPASTSNAICQEIVEEPALDRFPVLQ